MSVWKLNEKRLSVLEEVSYFSLLLDTEVVNRHLAVAVVRRLLAVLQPVNTTTSINNNSRDDVVHFAFEL